MFPTTRRQAILAILEVEGTVRTIELAQRFQVTDETIRKDLEVLHLERRLVKFHGGATREFEVRQELPLPERASLHPREKDLVAREAVKLIQPRDTVFFDASSTVLTMAKFLGSQPVTVLTNAHHVVVALGGRPNCELVCTGGQYEESSRSYVGIGAEEALRHYVIRWVFAGVDGLHPVLGASELNPGQAALKRRLRARAEKLCLVGDHSKLGRTSPFLFAAPNEIDVLVTDDEATPEMLAPFRDAGIEVILAKG